MKILLIVLAVLAAIITLICFVRIKLCITYRRQLKIGVYAGPVCLNRYLDGSRKRKKKGKKGAAGTGKQADKHKKEKKPLSDSLEEILRVVKEFTSRFFGHVRVRCARIIIAYGASDPAKTAVGYGVVVQIVAYIVEILKQNTDFSLAKDAIVRVEPDFMSCKTNVDIDITLSVSIGGILHSLLAAARSYIFKKS